MRTKFTYIKIMAILILSLFIQNKLNAQDIAFVHASWSNTTNGLVFDSLMTKFSYKTQLIPNDSIGVTDFSKYKLIIIDYNNSLDSTFAMKINSANIPILGMGYGGANTYNYYNISLKDSNAMTGIDSLIYISNFDQKFLNQPNAIQIGLDSTIQILEFSYYHKVIYKDFIADTAQIYAYMNNSFRDFAIVAREGKYYMWGIGGGVSSYLQAGKDLLVNLISEIIGEPTTSVDQNNISVKQFSLNQNYPNPFNPTTSISYQLSESGKVNMKVYDMLGKEVSTLVDENQIEGFYKVNFDASSLSSGIYFYKIQTENFIETKKMILVK